MDTELRLQTPLKCPASLEQELSLHPGRYCWQPENHAVVVEDDEDAEGDGDGGGSS